MVVLNGAQGAEELLAKALTLGAPGWGWPGRCSMAEARTAANRKSFLKPLNSPDSDVTQTLAQQFL
ncbi:hypothetical protein [Nonomuraea basaltis]|uniref:hypothetical protein n=1 Tax=Nonomuraea basaltis TaxID=2495887 RepID=UPI001F0F9B55|nr:hypothetical protein [Nonomuraea basaltis]